MLDKRFEREVFKGTFNNGLIRSLWFRSLARIDAKHFQSKCLAFLLYLKVSKNQNDFMKTSFLPKSNTILKDFCPII